MKYNPGLMPEDALVDGFAVRHDELQTILGVVRDNQGQHNQHLLVLAPRGYGKSTLALRVVAELRRAPDLAAAWFPIAFSEESYQVRTTGELWLEALLHLSQATGDDRWRQAWKALRTEPDDTRLARGALAHLLDFADAAGRRLLLVIENLDSLLGGDQLDPQDAWTLRHTLVQEPRIAVLATAVHRFPGIDQPDQAMFDLFRRVELGPLSPADCRALWLAVTTADRTSADAAHPSLDGRQAHALRVLTGGNPRLLIMLAGFARDQDLDDVLGTLDRLVDDHTEYFRANIEALSGQNRRVFLALAELWRPASARAVAEAARMPVNEVSVALGRLVQQGRVEITRTRGRNHSYQVSERLYNIYYLLRRHRGADVRVQALVDFITRLYGPTQKAALIQALATQALDRPEGQRQEHLELQGQVLKASQADADALGRMLGRVPPLLLRSPDQPYVTRTLLKRPRTLRALLAGTDGTSWLDEAAEACTRLHKDTKPGEEQVALAREVARHPEAGVRHLLDASRCLALAEAWTELVDALQRAWALGFQVPQLFRMIANTLFFLGRTDEARAILEEGLREHPGDDHLAGILAGGWVRLAWIDGAKGLWTRSLDAADQALAILPNAWEAMSLRTSALMALGRWDEAALLAGPLLDRAPLGPEAWLLRSAMATAFAPDRLPTLWDEVLASPQTTPALRLTLASLAVQRAPPDPRALAMVDDLDLPLADRSVRARLRGAIHGPAAAFEDLRPALIDPATVSADLQRAQADCMRLAAAGLSRELIALLEGAPTEEALRPLIAALRLREGEEVDEPPEILAVAADVNANIDALIQTGEPWTTDPHSLPLPEP